MRRSLLREELGVFGLDDLVIIVVIVVVVVVIAILVDDARNSPDCDFECQRGITCDDEADLCHASCFPDETQQDCHNECNRAHEACSNLGPAVAVGQLTEQSGLEATTDKWQHHASCRNGQAFCAEECRRAAAATSLPRPTDPNSAAELIAILEKTNACSAKCDETYEACAKAGAKVK